jgi:hypothetical protein
MKTKAQFIKETIELLKSLDYIDELIKDCEKSWLRKKNKKKLNLHRNR